MKESGVNVISWTETDAIIEDIQNRTRRICADYHRGILSESESCDRFSCVLHEGFSGFLNRKGLRLWIHAGNWERFSGEFYAWRRDREDDHLRKYSWLFFRRADEAPGTEYADEAAVPDKIQVIRILDAFHIPIEYFRPVPEGILCPDLHPAHFPNERIVGDEIWEKDDGLARGDVYPGERKTLIDHYGLKTEIRIEKPADECGKKRFPDADYAGTGTIEGYTSSRPREILVYMSKGKEKISRLKFMMGTDDDPSRFPLWAEYYQDRAEIERIREKVIRDMIHETQRA